MTTEKVENKDEEIVEEKKIDPIEPVEIKLTAQEQQAYDFGWQPREDWVKNGKLEEDWVPAKHFLKFGELKNQVIAKDKQLTKAEKLVKLMKNHHLQVKEQAKKEAIEALRDERRAALENNDLVKAEYIRDQIESTTEKFDKQRAIPAEIEAVEREVTPPAVSVPPEFYDFHNRNPWYITDPKRQDEISTEADKIGFAEVESARMKGERIDLKEVYKTVEKKIRKLYPEKFETPRSPQSDGPGKTSASAAKVAKNLSDEEAAVAKAFGLTPEKYVEQQKTYKGRQ